MKPTKIQTLLAWAVLAATAGYLVPRLIVANGGQVPVAAFTMIFTLPTVAILLVIFAIPMIRRARGAKAKPAALLNPFYAVRVVLLAKAIAISGAIFTGWHAGVVWLQATSPVIPAGIWPNLAALIGAILMVVAGIVIERVCRIRDDGRDGQSGSAGAGSTTEVNPA